MSKLSKAAFHSEPQAFEYLEKTLWPEGPVCPHCRAIGHATKLQGKATRIGVWKCNEKPCRKQFTVKVGTVFEHGRIPLHKMLQAVYLLCCSKKGCSSHQLHRILGITYKSAWFLSHRIREAMMEYRGIFTEPLGGAGKVVEVDETYIGRKAKSKAFLPPAQKEPVFALVERQGAVRSFHVPTVRADNLRRIMGRNISRESDLMSDEAATYTYVGHNFASHETVAHEAKEYVRGHVHTNTIEGYFSILKRGIYGVYQHCSEKHLHRYLAEFDFRYSNRVRLGVNDEARTDRALKGISGKRLTYRNPHGTAAE